MTTAGLATICWRRQRVKAGDALKLETPIANARASYKPNNARHSCPDDGLTTDIPAAISERK